MKRRYSVFLTLAILLFCTANSANASLDRSYRFETETGGITPDAIGNANAVLNGYATYPNGGSVIIADAGGLVFHNGRRKLAENVMDCIPFGGASSTYSGYNGTSHSVALWFKTDGEWIPGVDNWNGLFSVSLTAELQVGGEENRNDPPFGNALLNGGYVQSFSYTGANSWVCTDPAFEGLPGQVELDDGDWHHVVRTFGPTGTKIYIDGALAATGPSAGQANNGNTSLTIGVALPSAYASSFKGQIDNVHIYSHVLSATDVSNLYISETTTIPPPPPPSKPVNPGPISGTTDLSINTDISWSDGGGAIAYNVYFGTDPDPDSGELVVPGQVVTSYNPGSLSYGTTYFWRIDAKNAGGTITGDVWSFTTKVAVVEDLAAWYEFNSDASDTMDNYDGTFGFGVSVIVDAERGKVMNCTGNGSALLSPYEMPTGPATTAMWFKTTQSTVSLFQSGSPAGAKDIYIGGSKAPGGAVGSFVWAGGPGSWITSSQSNYNDGQWHHLVRVIGSLIYSDHILYLDGVEVDRQAGIGPDSLRADSVQIGGSANFATANFIGRIDDIRFYNGILLPEEIRQLAGMAGSASNPYPKDGYTLAKEVSQALTLNWTPGSYVQGVNGHKVYFGTDENAVINREASVYKGAQSQSDYTPGSLDYNTTYYWAVDEVNSSAVPYIWPGEVWSFTTTRIDTGKPTVYHLDIKDFGQYLSTKEQYDLRHIAVCVQGLANRQAPRVFIRFIQEDEIWWDRLQEPGGLCEGWPIVNVNNVQELVDIFRNYINGVVLYNPDPENGVNSTSHVASVVAGVEGCIAVRKDTAPGSMYDYLVNDVGGPQLPVLFDLTGKFTGSGTIWQTSTPSTGSAKCDAYIWAKEKYIDTGKCDPTTVFYTLDMYGLKIIPNNPNRWQLTNLDYMIRQKGFVFDLSPWLDEPSTDEPSQPAGTDGQTFRKLLDACNNQTQKNKMIKWMAFQDGEYKYTDTVNGSHDFWETMAEIDIISNQYNCYTEPDAPGINYISNCSFYGGLKRAVSDRRLVQNPAPTYNDMVSRGLIDGSGNVPVGNYIMTFMGDYDNCSWTLYWCAGQRYDDNRGQGYLTWAVNPTSLDRAPVALDYMYRHKTSKDYFMAPNSGAGWVMPTWLYNRTDPAYSQYPSIILVWQKHCREYYRLADYTISGWLLDGLGHSLSLTDVDNYTPFSGDGIGGGSGTPLLRNNIPVYSLASTDPFQSDIIDYSSGVNFACYRTIIVYPMDILNLEQQWSSSGHNHRFIDAYTYYYLMRYYLGGSNDYRATWVSDTIPRVMAAGATYPVKVTVRNDGWDTWSTDDYKLVHTVITGQGQYPSPELVVNNDGLHSAQERSGSINLAVGKHPIMVTFFEATGLESLEVRYEGPDIAKQLIPNAVLYRTDVINGVDYEYYEGAWTNLPDFDALTPKTTGTASNFDIHYKQRYSDFAFRFTGFIDISTAGTYTFYTTSNEGSKLYIGGEYLGGGNEYQYHPVPTDVAPGRMVVFSFNLTAPSANGNYELYYDMEQDGVTTFSEQNNIEWKKEIIVATNETDVDTDGDGLPDVAEEAKGTLYWNPDDVVRKKGDFEPDGDVDLMDFVVLAEHWLQNYPPADIAPESPDGIINLLDLSVLAQDWLYGTEW